MKQNSLQNWSGLRIIYPQKNAFDITLFQKNLFWIKGGYLYFLEGQIDGEVAARALSILQQNFPFRELVKFDWVELDKAEECFYVDPDSNLLFWVKDRKLKNGFWYSFFKRFWKKSWSKEYPHICPVVPVRQIDKFQIGNARIISNKLRNELLKKH